MLNRPAIEFYTNGLCDVCLTRLSYWFIQQLEEFGKKHHNGIDSDVARALRHRFMELAKSEQRYIKTRTEMVDFIHAIFDLWPTYKHEEISSWIEQQLKTMKNYCLTGVGHGIQTEVKLNLNGFGAKLVKATPSEEILH